VGITCYKVAPLLHADMLALQEVVGPPASEGFTFLRLPLRDTDDEDIIARLQEASQSHGSALGQPALPDSLLTVLRVHVALDTCLPLLACAGM
jgi:hypothetical protein